MFMALTALQPQPEPKATPRSAQWCQIGEHGPWQTVVPVPRAIASSFRVALQITFRNKIPFVGLLRCDAFIMTFGNWAVYNLRRAPATFNVAGNRVVSQSRGERPSRLAGDHCADEGSL
jgi:hypothetical protein